jgi:hypothetical protein
MDGSTHHKKKESQKLVKQKTTKALKKQGLAPLFS